MSTATNSQESSDVVTTPAHRAHMKRYWAKRTKDCRDARLCIKCRDPDRPLPPGAAMCESCKERRRLASKLRASAREDG